MNREIQLLVRFLDSIREYEHESGNSVYNDERESKEFVDIFLTTKEYQSLLKEEVKVHQSILKDHYFSPSEENNNFCAKCGGYFTAKCHKRTI